jgi:hypothetical protein
MHGVEMVVRKIIGQFVRVPDNVYAFGGLDIKNGDLVAIEKVRDSAPAAIPSAEIENSLEGAMGNLFKTACRDLPTRSSSPVPGLGQTA